MSIDYRKLENEFFEHLNSLRKDPKSFIPHVENLAKLFKGKILYSPGEFPLQTNEGIFAVEDCIEFLNQCSPVVELERRKELDKAAVHHCFDIGAAGLVGHEGTDGLNSSERIEENCELEITCSENLDFGTKNPLNMLVNLLIDDGVKQRGHRKNLHNPENKYVGVGIGFHKEYEICLVLDFVGGIREKGKPFYDKSSYKYEYPQDLSKKAEPRKINNVYQRDDPHAPDNCTSVKTIKETRLYDGKVIRITKKIYSLSDGTTSIVELQDI